MTHLATRPWVPAACETYIQRLATDAGKPSPQVAARIDALIDRRTAKSTTRTAST